MFKNLFTRFKTLFQSYDKLKVIHGLCLSKILAIINSNVFVPPLYRQRPRKVRTVSIISIVYY